MNRSAEHRLGSKVAQLAEAVLGVPFALACVLWTGETPIPLHSRINEPEENAAVRQIDRNENFVRRGRV